MKITNLFDLTETGSHALQIDSSNWIIRPSERMSIIKSTSSSRIDPKQRLWCCRDKNELIECLAFLRLNLTNEAVVNLSVLDESARRTWKICRKRDGKKEWSAIIDARIRQLPEKIEKLLLLEAGQSRDYDWFACPGKNSWEFMRIDEDIRDYDAVEQVFLADASMMKDYHDS